MPQRRPFVAVALVCTAVAVFLSFRSSLPENPSVARPPAATASSAPSIVPNVDPALCDPAPNPTDTAAQKLAAQTARRAALAQVAAFDAWLTDFRRADLSAAATSAGLEAIGLERAVARRAGLKHLIETDPARALTSAVPVGLRAELPSSVRDQLETWVDDRGRLEVSIYHRNGAAAYDRIVQVADRTYRAFVFGRREPQATKYDLPLHGIALDDSLALDAAPYRLLDDTEKSARGIPADAPALWVGRTLTVLHSAAELAPFVERLVAAEAGVGPHVADAFSGSPSLDAPPDVAAVTSPPSWITGPKRALFLKIDFSDDSGAAATDTQIQDVGTATVDYYTATSQTKTTFAFSILPTVLRMPKTKAYYEASQSLNNELYVAARDAAKAYDVANGGTGTWDPDKFDRYLIVHKRMATYLYGGVAQTGGPRIGINNAVNLATVGHELGHTQSLAHSHYWLPTGSSPVGAGSHVEYGDVFDIMGGGTLHFNVSQKAKLGYLDAAAITTVTANGTYRIARHDDPAAAGIRALKIAPADLGYEYWIEHRRNAPSSFNAAQLDRVRNGVLIHWGTEKSPSFTTGSGTYLLDATPGSGGGAADAPFRIGETFVDPDAGITVKPLAVGGTAPNEYIDVQVGFGAIDGNRNPSLVADAPTGALAARTNIIFNASGTDPDGDPVYFRWDFGDGSFQPNLPSITRRFPKGGSYTVRVSSHDGKGGIAVKNLALTVSDPLTTWTSRPSGLTANLYGAIYAGGKFVVVGDNGVNLSSPDGVTWTRGTVPSNAHFYRSIAHNGARFVTVGVAAVNATLRATGAYSTDGATWTAATMPSGVGTMVAVAYGAGRFVSVGENGRIYNSPDGATWTEVTSPVTTSLSAVAYADNLFVATGVSGRILTSADGVNWTNRSVSTGNTINTITRHKSQWVAAVSAFECFVSDDGATWTRIATAGRTNSNNSQRMISAAGVLLGSTLAGGISFTEDPRTWNTQQVDANAATIFYGLAEGAGQIIMVGQRGLIYATTATPASPVLPAPALRMEADSIKVAVGKKNVLAASGRGFVKLELYVNGIKVSELAGSAGALTWTPTTIGNYLLTVRGLDASGASVVSATYPAVAAFTNWKWLNPGPLGADLRGATRADGKWWIVGGGGALLTLDDAGNLTPIDFPTTQQLNAIAYANGRFVIATTDLDGGNKEDIGGLWTSSDGYSWTPFLSGTLDSANLNTVIYAADRWIGLGSGGTIVTSTDGVNWPRAVSGLTQALFGVATGKSLVVAVGAAGKIITSADGLTWTERASGVTTDLRAVTFASGTFVAVGVSGVILTSPDAVTWTRATSGTTTNLYGIAYLKGVFHAGGDNGTLLTSATGATWTAAGLNNNTSGTLYLTAEGDNGLLVGRAGEVYATSASTAWRRLTTGTSDPKQAVLYAGGRWISVGSNTDAITRAAVIPIQTSTDGITWKPAAPNSAFAPLTAVAYGQQRYVAVGPASAIFTSPDGTTWTQRPISNTAAFSSLAAGPSAFVAGSSGSSIYSSPDGTTWTQRAFGTTFPVRGVAYGAGRFVAVGDGGNIRHSPDGTTWTAATSGVTTALLAVGYWDDVGFLAVGSSGVILNSADGLTWSQRESGIAENLGALARTPLGFVAAGGTQGTLLISLDSISWSLSALPADKTIRGLAASTTAIVAVGDSGAHLAFELGDTGTPPTIAAQPVARSGIPGETIRFSVSAQNASGAVYQWQKDGVPLPGANSPVLTLPAVTLAQAGSYTVKITSSAGSVTSTPAALLFAAPSNPGRLINLSILTSVDPAPDSFTMGYVVGGAGTVGAKPLVIRAAGPSLGALGVPGTLDDPKLETFAGSVSTGINDNWGGSATLTAALAAVGAFPYSGPASKDAAVTASITSRDNSVVVSSAGPGAGTVIAELYDATPTPAFTVTTPRLINVSVRKHLGTGVTMGFVLGGSAATKVLVRAIGPTLGAFGVPGTVADPQLTLFNDKSAKIGENNDWGGTAELTAAFNSVGAFALPANSKDAAVLVTLQPGLYSVQVSGVNSTTGVAIVEVYEVP